MQGELSENKRNKLTSINKKKCQRLLDTYQSAGKGEISSRICYNYRSLFWRDFQHGLNAFRTE